MARVILAASRPDDLVLDPFCGTGTTGAVAQRLRRRFIGFERERAYAAAAEKRIATIEPMPEPSLATFMTAREAPRVPFAVLIERGMILPGIKLTDFKRRHRALVRADGAVSLGDAVGSIHRIGALAQGLEAERLDLLAHRDAEGLNRDRHAARPGALGDGGGRRISALLRRRNDFYEQFKRAFGERIHIRQPFRAAGAQRDRALGKTGLSSTRNRDAGVAGRIAVAVAARPRGAGFAKTPDCTVPFAHTLRQE